MKPKAQNTFMQRVIRAACDSWTGRSSAQRGKPVKIFFTVKVSLTFRIRVCDLCFCSLHRGSTFECRNSPEISISKGLAIIELPNILAMLQ